MTHVIRRPAIAMAFAALLSLAAFFDAGAAQAQVYCQSVHLINNTGYKLGVTFIATSGVSEDVFNIPPGVSGYNFPPGFDAEGVVTLLNNYFPFPAVGNCTPCLTVSDGAGGTCCVAMCHISPCTFEFKLISPCPATCN